MALNVHSVSIFLSKIGQKWPKITKKWPKMGLPVAKLEIEIFF